MKKLLLISFIVLTYVFAQTPGPKWVTILDLADQKVFVDTSTIKEYQNQISVLSITFFKTPQKIESLNGLASSVKSRILFNLGIQKYSTIGTLYYDDKLKILGETSLPGFAGNSEAFSVPIDSNQIVSLIYSYCLKYLNRGERTITEKDFSANSDQTKKALDKLNPKQTKPIEKNPPLQKQKVEQKENALDIVKEKFDEQRKEKGKASINDIQTESKSDPVPSISKVEKDLTKKTDKKETASTNTKNNLDAISTAAQDTSVKVIDNLAKKRAEALRTLTSKTKVVKAETNEKTAIKTNTSETNPKETIFLDGGKYSFQVSSWKSKTKAESEAAKLKSQGHNSFIVEAFVNKRRGTWYRVRIGYFDTLEEAEAYQSKLK